VLVNISAKPWAKFESAEPVGPRGRRLRRDDHAPLAAKGAGRDELRRTLEAAGEHVFDELARYVPRAVSARLGDRAYGA